LITRIRNTCLILLVLCAASTMAEEINPQDPWEKSNRAVYEFNDFLDRNFLLPVAQGYDYITPVFVQDGFRNFFNNLAEPTTLLNDLLQLKMVSFYRTTARFAINSVLGIGGVIDLAKYIQLERQVEDLGQTLGYWGVGAGPYTVIPFLGPSTARDTLPTILTFIYGSDLVSLPIGQAESNLLTFISIIDRRNRLRPLEASIIGDRYSYLRDAFLQNRRYQVLDGQIPLDVLDELEELDDLEDLEELDQLDELEFLNQPIELNGSYESE